MPNTIKDFLEKFRPNGPWHLAAINKDKNNTFLGKRFTDASEAEKWALNQNNNSYNLYFHVNPVKGSLEKGKAKKEDISTFEWLHVDIDPRVGEDLQSEQRRIQELLTSKLPEQVPEPSVITFSGGGYQAFWKLEKPMPLNTDQDRAEAEAYNRELENKFGADSCHNVDRLMRLPGTINIPDAKKKRKGRKEVEAKLVEFNDTAYPHTSFKRVNCNAIKETKPKSWKIEPVDSLDELKISDRLKIIAAQGKDPDKPKKGDKSRSAWLWHFIRYSLQAGLEPGKIQSIITNPHWRISESVLEKKDPHKYAQEQIWKAESEVNSGWPDSVNEKTGIPLKSYNNTRTAIQKLDIQLSYNDFSGRSLIEGDIIKEFAGELSDKACVKIRDLIFHKFGFDSGKQNVDDATGSLCLDHKFDPVCNYLDHLHWDGQTRLDRMLVDYFGANDTPFNRAVSRIIMVAAVRRARTPGVKFDTMLILEGEQGTGKSTALSILAVKSEYFSDSGILHLDEKQQQELIKGVWIYEVSELVGLRKTSLEKLKNFLSRTEDRARPAYAKKTESWARRCVFIATTNSDEYLSDPTGNRRYWPVKTGEIQLDKLKQDRDQLWAEAAVLEAAGESITLPEELWAAATKAQEEREEHHPWVDELKKWMENVRNQLKEGHCRQFEVHDDLSVQGDELRVSSSFLLTEILKIPIDKQNSHDGRMLKACMKKLGWEGSKKMKINGISFNGYSRSIKEWTQEAQVELELEPENPSGTEEDGKSNVVTPVPF